jgi:hypothetical protein
MPPEIDRLIYSDNLLATRGMRNAGLEKVATPLECNGLRSGFGKRLFQAYIVVFAHFDKLKRIDERFADGDRKCLLPRTWSIRRAMRGAV